MQRRSSAAACGNKVRSHVSRSRSTHTRSWKQFSAHCEVEDEDMSASAFPMTDDLPTAAMAELAPTVFVVDDDISVRESLEGLIASAGWHVATFDSARSFL